MTVLVDEIGMGDGGVGGWEEGERGARRGEYLRL